MTRSRPRGNLPLSAIVALALGAQSELTRTNLLASLNEDEDEEPPTVLPWDWERMLQVSASRSRATRAARRCSG